MKNYGLLSEIISSIMIKDLGAGKFPLPYGETRRKRSCVK